MTDYSAFFLDPPPVPAVPDPEEERRRHYDSVVLPWLDPNNPLRQAGALPTPIGSNAPPRQAGIVDAARRVGAAFLEQVPGAIDIEEQVIRGGAPTRYLPRSVQDALVQGVVDPKRRALAAIGKATGLPLTHEAVGAERDRWRELGHGDTSPEGEAIADTAAEALGGLVLNPPFEGLAAGLAGGVGKLGRAAERAPGAARALEELVTAAEHPPPLGPITEVAVPVPREGRAPRQIPPYPPGTDGPMSLKGVANVAGMQQELGELAEKNAHIIQEARGGRQSVDQYHDAAALADSLGMTVKDFLETPAGTVLGSRELALGRSLMGGLHNEVKALSAELASGKLTGEAASLAKDRLADKQADLVRLMATLHGKGYAEAGRTLRSAQETVDAFGMGPKENLQMALVRRYRDLLEGPEGDDLVKKIAQLDPERPEDLMGFLRQVEKPTFRQYRSSYWFGSILSGTKTLLRNGIGNAVKLAVDTAVRPVAAGADALRVAVRGGERSTYASETIPALVGLHKGMAKGWERFLFVMKEGYDPERLVQELTEGAAAKWEAGSGRLPADPFVLSPDPKVRKAGAALNFGPRLLAATDALSRSIADTSERYAWATRRALEDVRDGKAASIGDRAAALLLEQPEEMVKAAREFAAKATYTDRMSGIGGVAARLRGVLNDYSGSVALGDHLLPFIHVSDRVAAGITDFIPLSKPGKLVRSIGAKSPEAADFVARQVIGGGLTMLGLSLANQGRLVGSAPKDPKHRDDFYGEGKQPYSLLIGGSWVPMRDVLGPLAGPFVTAAAIHDHMRSSPPGEKLPEKLMRGAWGGGIETARYMLDASYLQTLQSVVSSLDEEKGTPGAGLAKAGARTAAGYLPWSGLERGVAQALDPRVVERTGVADEVKAAIPGLRNTLPARIGPAGNELTITTGRAGGLSPLVPTDSTVPDPQLAERVQSGAMALRQAAKELTKAHDRVTSAAKTRDFDRAKDLRESHPEYRFATYAKTQAERISQLESTLRQIRVNPHLTPEQKAERQRALLLRMSLITERALATLGRAQQP